MKKATRLIVFAMVAVTMSVIIGSWPAMAARGKPRKKVVTAIARELSAFLWAMAKQVQPAL